MTQTTLGQIDSQFEGARLDRALELLLPGSGLRLRRRLIESGRVLLDGRSATAGRKVRQGQTLELLPGALEEAAPVLAIAAHTKDYAAVVKPAGLHSAAICGSSEPSVEALLADLFPGQAPVLLNRLDRETSGLLLVAQNAKAQRAFARLSPQAVVKEYDAVVHGELEEELTLRFVLDTDDRKRTRVVAKLNQDEAGWTRVRPVRKLPGGLSVLRVRIVSGARHQIRAHLAFAGLPILGDPMYGMADDGAPRMYLHHGRIAFPGFEARCEPNWPDPALIPNATGPLPEEESK